MINIIDDQQEDSLQLILDGSLIIIPKIWFEGAMYVYNSYTCCGFG